jgi:hypothetical protein
MMMINLTVDVNQQLEKHLFLMMTMIGKILIKLLLLQRLMPHLLLWLHLLLLEFRNNKYNKNQLKLIPLIA